MKISYKLKNKILRNFYCRQIYCNCEPNEYWIYLGDYDLFDTTKNIFNEKYTKENTNGSIHI